MKKITLLLGIACVITVFSCKEEKKAEDSSQMQQVMAVHDEVMPKMSKLGQLVGKLKPMADSLGMDSPQGKAMLDLQDANKSMMDWMQGIGKRFDADEIMKGKALTEEKQKWLDEEEEKVNVAKEKINSSIANAEALLNAAN
jgi:membrane-bound lytic murein transglycosylase B